MVPTAELQPTSLVTAERGRGEAAAEEEGEGREEKALWDGGYEYKTSVLAGEHDS